MTKLSHPGAEPHKYSLNMENSVGFKELYILVVMGLITIVID